MSGIRELLNDTLAKLDAKGSLELHEVTAALEQVGKSAKESGESIDELKYEFFAAYLELCDEPNVWGTHFGPEMWTVDKDGNRFDSPPLDSITPECIAYWSTRMRVAGHPALRARYADMAWDLSRKAAGSRPPIEAARIAIDSKPES